VWLDLAAQRSRRQRNVRRTSDVEKDDGDRKQTRFQRSVSFETTHGSRILFAIPVHTMMALQ
jgi:hypothetical protein